MNKYLEKKLENFFVLKNLMQLKSHDLTQNSIYKLQNKKIQKLMKRAYEIPLYKKKFEECGLMPQDFKCRKDLEKFPVLTKKEIKDWISEELKSNPSKYKYFRTYTTSGSTGTPLVLCASPKENAYFSANWLRIIMENGINPFFDSTMALKDPVIVAKGRDSIIQKFGILRRHKVSFLADGEVIAKEINRVEPDFLYAHRTKLMQTIEYAQKNKLKLAKPKAYASISETLTKKSIELMKEFLGDNLFTSFGSMETGACTFTKVGNINKHIVTNDTHVINVVSRENGHNKDKKMVITNLFLYEFPIINYDIGDGASVFEENGVEYLTDIHGRLNDWVILEDGRNYDYHPFYAVTENVDEILSFRVIQESYHDLYLELVAKSDVKINKDMIEKQMVKRLDDIIVNYTMNYHFVWKDKLEADDNGKLRFIVNRLNNEANGRENNE